MRAVQFGAALVIALGATACTVSQVLYADPDGSVFQTDSGPSGDDASPPPDAACAIPCGARCCAGAESCVEGRCQVACEGVRCGADDLTCCLDGNVCLGGECATPGEACEAHADCGPGRICEPLLRRCVWVPDEAVCSFVPPPRHFEPVLEWQWNGGDVWGNPVVVPLNDDNGDGAVDGEDIPDVVVLNVQRGDDITFGARLTALNGDDGTVLWETPYGSVCTGGLAAADLDGDGHVEIVTLGSDGSFACGDRGPRGSPRSPFVYTTYFDHDGHLKALGPAPSLGQGGLDQPSLADLDGDGLGEVVFGDVVLDAYARLRWRDVRLTSSIHAAFPADRFHPSSTSIADLDGDGRLEIVNGTIAFRHDGSVFWTGGRLTADWGVPPETPGRGITAIGYVLDTGIGSDAPQIVESNNEVFEVLDGETGALLYGPYEFYSEFFPGPTIPMLGNLDGDPESEILITTTHYLYAFDPSSNADAPLRWQVSVPGFGADNTTPTDGATVYDFEADGLPEVVLVDRCHMRIFDAASGDMLWYTGASSRGLGIHYPLVVDVDHDDHAEIVTVGWMGTMGRDPMHGAPRDCGNADFTSRITPWRGVQVWGDSRDSWVPSRTTFNQYSYHGDNIGEDGALPWSEPASWRAHGTWRTQPPPPRELVSLAVDLEVVAVEGELWSCSTGVLSARVRNRGALGAPAGVRVAFYQGSSGERGPLLGVGLTDELLLSGDATWVRVEVLGVTLDEGFLTFHAVADDTGGVDHSEFDECVEDNNDGPSVTLECDFI